MRHLYSTIATSAHLRCPLSSSATATATTKLLLQWPNLPTSLPPPKSAALPEHPSSEVEDPSSLQSTAAAISGLLTKPFASPSDIAAALDETGAQCTPPLLETVLRNSELSPKPVLALFRWARAKPDFRTTPSLLASVVDVLGKSRSFAAAWSLIIHERDWNVPLDAFSALIRRYCRVGMPQAAIRTYRFAQESSSLEPSSNAADLFDVLIDALCKEGHTKAASDCVVRRKAEEPEWSPTARCYNILLNGWFRARKLKKAEQLWADMQREGVRPTVVTYGTVIEGLCRARRVEQAMATLEEMRGDDGIEPNTITCNPIVDTLAEAGRFKDAMGFVEKFPLYGISPNISTYNSLVKGFCKNGDLVGASKVLKTMIGRGVLPTPTTYNYFFRFFSKSGMVEEGLNLYSKIVQSGHSPNRLTYQLMIKIMCENNRLDSAVQMIRDMNMNGFDSDLATGTMLVHLLCRMQRWDEACVEFEEMIKKGVVPQQLTFQMLLKDLKRLGMVEMARKITSLMGSITSPLHSTKVPSTYKGQDGEMSFELRKSIVNRAKAMSHVLKLSKDRKQLSELKSCTETAMKSANTLIANIKKRVGDV